MQISIFTNNFIHPLQNNTKQQILGFQNTTLKYCHEYIFWKLFNLQKPRYWEES